MHGEPDLFGRLSDDVDSNTHCINGPASGIGTGGEGAFDLISPDAVARMLGSDLPKYQQISAISDRHR